MPCLESLGGITLYFLVATSKMSNKWQSKPQDTSKLIAMRPCVSSRPLTPRGQLTSSFRPTRTCHSNHRVYTTIPIGEPSLGNSRVGFLPTSILLTRCSKVVSFLSGDSSHHPQMLGALGSLVLVLPYSHTTMPPQSWPFHNAWLLWRQACFSVSSLVLGCQLQ